MLFSIRKSSESFCRKSYATVGMSEYPTGLSREPTAKPMISATRPQELATATIADVDIPAVGALGLGLKGESVRKGN